MQKRQRYTRKLWFDVEEGYNTTELTDGIITRELWFDVEEGYNTTRILFVVLPF